LDYDIATAQKKILAAGLPERLVERLAYGRQKAEKDLSIRTKNFARRIIRLYIALPKSN
jgi:hypothetical protein